MRRKSQTEIEIPRTGIQVQSVDPTRSTDRRDSLLNGRKNVKRKCGLIFEFWKIRPKGGTVLL